MKSRRMCEGYLSGGGSEQQQAVIASEIFAEEETEVYYKSKKFPLKLNIWGIMATSPILVFSLCTLTVSNDGL